MYSSVGVKRIAGSAKIPTNFQLAELWDSMPSQLVLRHSFLRNLLTEGCRPIALLRRLPGVIGRGDKRATAQDDSLRSCAVYGIGEEPPPEVAYILTPP